MEGGSALGLDGGSHTRSSRSTGRGGQQAAVESVIGSSAWQSVWADGNHLPAEQFQNPWSQEKNTRCLFACLPGSSLLDELPVPLNADCEPGGEHDSKTHRPEGPKTRRESEKAELEDPGSASAALV
jgi:hypothetical protein